MAGTRWGRVRGAALGLLLAFSVLLLVASEADAGKYAVAQCGWYVGADADWADTTGGAKFRSDAYCVPPAGGDAFAGVHLKSFTRDGQATVSGTRFARWRWTAPPGTGITAVRGTWWHALHDGLEQRLGAVNWAGDFVPSMTAATTDTVLREFSLGFGSPVPAFEDRLLCARGEARWCSLEQGSWSGLRALTLTVQDDTPPAALLTGGFLVAGGWRRGTEHVVVGGIDGGSGVRFGESFVDGSRVQFNEYPCDKVSIGGEWRATRMRPCKTNESTTHWVNTASLSDGTHDVVHCTTDFAGNGACTGNHPFRVDNNPPAHPRAVGLAGGDGWRRVNDFDLSWANPDQGQASPIAGAHWRIVGPAGYDSGVKLVVGRDIATLTDRSVPRPGAFTLSLWLRDEAGNESPPSAVEVPLRLDDVRPGLAFAAGDGAGVPDRVRAEISDSHSGPASGAISYRRLNAAEWTELPTRFEAEAGSEKATLAASLPELAAGTYVFRAEAADRAGNTVSTTLRADGTEMAVRKAPPPPVAAQRALAPRAKTRLFARLRGGHGRGDALTIPFGASALLSGRLTRADGAGVAGRELRVVARPSRGALAETTRSTVLSGERGGFELRLAPGPSRRVTISFGGDSGLEPARRPSLELRVRSGVSLRAAPSALWTGDAVRLSGRVRTRGAPVPRRGKLIAIQYLEAATGRWRPVLVTRTDHAGRFRARYRFRYVSGTASIRLRATALAEERWPYAPGSSRPVTLRVRGR
jgi:hypothetical protein